MHDEGRAMIWISLENSLLQTKKKSCKWEERTCRTSCAHGHRSVVNERHMKGDVIEKKARRPHQRRWRNGQSQQGYEVAAQPSFPKGFDPIKSPLKYFIPLTSINQATSENPKRVELTGSKPSYFPQLFVLLLPC